MSTKPFPDFTINIIDNIDPITIAKTHQSILKESNAFLVISKSGNTIEVIQIVKFLVELKVFNDKNLFAILGKHDSTLRAIVSQNQGFIIPHTDISGRFSIMHAPAILGAMISGVHAKNIMKLTNKHTQELLSSNKQKLLLVLQHIIVNTNKNRTNFINIFYGDQLIGLFEWVRQMYAESLGKKKFGINYICARGTIDEHSQCQLYLDGPDDKFFQITYLNNSTESERFGTSSFNYNMHVHAMSVTKALQKCDKPVSFLTKDDPYELVAYVIAETILTVIILAKIYNINPYDQPAVEYIKENLDK